MIVQRHTSRVRFLRWFLPVLAIFALLIVVIVPLAREFHLNWQSKHSKTRLRVEEVAVSLPKDGKPAQLQVTNPEFSGQDSQGHPYVVRATRVVQDGMTPGASIMTLQKPQAVLLADPQQKNQVNLTAETGTYDPAAKTLDLSGPVVITNSDGFRLDLQELSVNLTEGTSVSNQPVTGTGPAGQIFGEKLELRDKGNTIILHGKSKVVLTPKEAD